MAAETNSEQVERIEVQGRRGSILAEITENTEKLVAMPGAMGDPLQAAFALPGVVAAGGSMSEPAVRGSSPDDNLFEIDFMPAGYIFHDFGSSIFNKHLVRNFKLYSAAYGSSYSNATGAVFDVSLRNPRFQPLKTTLDFTMFNAGAFVEGQLSEKVAFYLSARKSTLPLFFSKGEELEDDDGDPSGITINDPPDDNDYQGKFLWEIDNNNALVFSFTGARDSAAANFNQRAEISLKNPEYQGDADFSRGFNSQSLIWDHYGKDFWLKMGVGVLDHSERLEYGQSSGNGMHEEEIEKQISYKARMNFQLKPNHQLLVDLAYFDAQTKFDYDMLQMTCTEIDPDCDLRKGERVTGVQVLDTDNYFVGVSHLWDINDNWQSELALQWQHNQYTDEDFISPRLALSYFVSDTSTVTLKYGRYNRMQDVEYVAKQIGNPKLKSQTSNHTALGFQQELADEWSWSVEGYYKTMSDLPLALTENSPDAELLYSNDVKGRAYGVDFLINKNKTDNWYGWLSLGYAKSERTDLRKNVTRDYYADTPLIINMVVNYQINDLWNAGINFTARSGQAYTQIVGVKENPDYDDKFLPVYGEAFSERFDLSHRLDVRVERKTDFFGYQALLIFEVMNVYGQDNVSYIDLDYKNVHSTQDLLLKEENDDFEMRPSIGFSVSF